MPAPNEEEFDPYATQIQQCLDENLDIALTAPPENQWYHGRMGRNIAEDKLKGNGIMGAYLIRESDRKPGSYVLSFLGSTGVSHFRITALCGDYYIGGRQFSSLTDLIGYYTVVSDLLKGERLQQPVAPDEPVDDQRRVVAILPYTKMADTDELSFHKGDVFLVHNAMGDGWLWVTNLQTQESGLIYQDLTEELKPAVDDGNEGCLWFHASISKQEAADKLVKAGEGSYLARASDQSPGDYTLYFFVQGQVQRFRIQKQPVGGFLMGGRTFSNLSAIVERYKKEQIVEGYTLTNAVLRAADEIDAKFLENRTMQRHSEEDSKYIYEAIQRTKGYQGLTSCMSGYLNKKSEKSKKWKRQHFILNSSDQQLYFFENERRTKPKGLIDLSYSSLYPVHDSFFDRPHCFQLVVRALTHRTVYYLCADTADEALEWARVIKPLCAQSQRQRHVSQGVACLKELRSLEVQILDGKRLPTKFAANPYCVVSLNDVQVCRSRVKSAPNPVWEEQFFLDDLPTDVTSYTMTIYNRARRSKDVAVAQITVDLDQLEHGEYVDEWYTLNPALYTQLKLPAELGSLRMKCRYLHEVIMPPQEYLGLKELVLDSELEVLCSLGDVCRQDCVHLAKALLRLFRNERIEARMLPAINLKQISREEAVCTLFRSTTLATTLMDQYMQLSAEYFVHQALEESVSRIVDSRHSCELNPDRLDKPSDLAANVDNFLTLLETVVMGIFRSADACPLPLRYMCGCLQKGVAKKWPNDATVCTRVVSGFIFLRLLCPALINPRMFNLHSGVCLSATASRTFTLVAKALQNLANLVEFGAKEPYMSVVNDFITSHMSGMVAFLNELSNVPVCPVTAENLLGDPARDLATLHQICVAHKDDLKSSSNNNATIRKLLTVTEMLSKHKTHYMESSKKKKNLVKTYREVSASTQQPTHITTSTLQSTTSL